ncbi:protein XRP2-like [Bacillus rossius redtenbacheri]|uniref:protein XRP2-like n=1 Tax=Bacillus rossius redtenbacheri TaxID=93214 RepID=UPI002FDD2408
MGCLLNKSRRSDYKVSKEDSFIKRKQYSWDKRQIIDLKDYTVENVENEEVWRMPGTIQGQQFVIQNCKNTRMFIFDHLNSVNIDECTNCQIVLGAVKGSVFLRNCTNCVCLVACGQFRTRDCRKMNIFLSCATQPIIESSTNIHFGCYQLHYSELEDHFQKAGLSCFNNNWSDIHDFTPMRGETNWCLLPDTIHIEDCVPLPSCDEPRKVNMSLSCDKSVIPFTWGLHKRLTGESCLVAFFSDGQQVQRAREFISSIRQEHPECLLLLSKEVQMQQANAERAFKTSAYNRVLERGQVIGLHYNGPSCLQKCEKVAKKIATSTGLPGLVYVSTNPKTAQQQVNDFFNYGDIQMTS